MLKSFLYRFSKKRSRVNLYRWIEEALVSFKINKRSHVLNIGAGGDVAEVLRRAGVKARSVDIDPGKFPDMVADIENLASIDDDSIEVVVCVEVLEHVKRPHVAIAELFRIVQPGGLVIGSTPFLLGIHDRPTDYFRFTGYGLRQLFADFEPVTLRERNGYFGAAAVLIHRRFVVGTTRERTVALLLSPLLLLLVLALELIDRISPSTDGTTGYFFVFRKPDTPCQR